MPFTYRDKPKLSDRFRGKSGEELLNELASDLDPRTRMFFDTPQSWRQRRENPSRFPRGFPFVDDRKRTDIRAYLDEIAARHPEFADQLREPPWDEDFSRSPVGRQDRGVEPEGAGNPSQVPGTSSQGPETSAEVAEPRQNLSNFGLRNTVPLGPSAVVEEERQQRSMSAPPDNRPVDKQKRFVTKCEIPIMHDPAQEPAGSRSDPSNKGPQENSQSKMNNSPTVRVIPIQVEGRDAPLLNTNFDTSSTNYGTDAFEGRLPRDFGAYQRHSPRFAHKERSATPPHQQYAQHFQQYVPPHQHFGHPQQFVPQQQQQQQQQQRPRHPVHPHQAPHAKPQQQYQQPRPYPPQQQHPPHQQQYSQPQQQQYHQRPPHPQQQQQHYQQEPQPHPQPPPAHVDETDSKPPQGPPPKPEPVKDPIEKVHVIQKEVEELMKQVESFNGNSRSDKQYLMLDELLTRQLLLLDNIDTEGKENVRQARKDTIRSIQRCISTLENKVPIGEAQEETGPIQKAEGGDGGGGGAQGENPLQAMEVDQTKENTPMEAKESQTMEVDPQGGEKPPKEPSEKAPEGESKEKAQ